VLQPYSTMKTLLSAREIAGVWVVEDVDDELLVDDDVLDDVLDEVVVEAVYGTSSTISSVMDTMNAWDVGLL
jgi:hypothetical protein